MNKKIFNNSFEGLLSKNYNESLAESIAKYLSSNIKELFIMSESERLKTIMEILMKAERRFHVDNNPQDKCNGYRPRKLNTSMGQIELEVPRDRDGDFYPSVLPEKYKRFDSSYTNLLKAGLNNFYSQTGMKNFLSSLDLPYSQEELKELSEKLYEEFQIWQQRELPQDVAALFIDGFHTQLYDEENRKMVKAVVYITIGIDFEGKKDLYSVNFITGHENKDSWLLIFNELINRGLKRPLVVVSDDFRGITDAVSVAYPGAYHQLCWTHFRRNIRRNMNKQDAKEFSSEMDKIKLERDFETGKDEFLKMLEKYKKKYPDYINNLEKKHEHILCFLRFEPKLRKYFYTTNIVESFNNILSIIERNSGSFFRSKKMLELNCYIKRNQLKNKNWSKPVPHIKANIYYLIQMFGLKYGENPKI